MKNLDQQVWDLLRDDQFVQWVYSPDKDSTAHWQQWVEQHPGRPDLLKRARELALELAGTEKPGEALQLAEDIWKAVQEKLTEQPAGAEETIHLNTRRLVRKFWYWAAACLLALAVGVAAIRYALPEKRATTVPVIQQVATLLVKEDLQRTNQTDHNQEVWLVDGSRVILQPGASIRHAAFLKKDKREIYLEGNAFFEVAPDAVRPFNVYTKDLVVRVLGTSFNVATNKENGDVTVLVRSGKVAVSKKTNPSHEPLILGTNQGGLYRMGTHDLIQASQDNVALPRLESVPPSIPLSFEEVPVVEIFQTLEKAYGIPMHYDKKTFSSCIVTTSLADETFEEKLKIICEAIGATYTLSENGVLIDGKPCKE
ncbi:MAG TPA: FecR family protein [Puia sp.]|nr:FecR family protein [Puia sp.]